LISYEICEISFTSNNFGDSYTIDLSDGVKVMVFNATFNNISVISWLSILFVDLPNGMNMLMKILCLNLIEIEFSIELRIIFGFKISRIVTEAIFI
jgi:hypothetical protein